jgi:hypothetical protein
VTGSRTLPLWQRNLIGAAVAAGALAVSVTATVWPPWTAYRSTVEPAHTVAAHQSYTLDGQTWSVGDIRRSLGASGSGAPLPEGTIQMTVTIERTGSIPADTNCNGVLTDGERTWRTIGPPCSVPGPLDWSFLVPVDARPTAVDITKLDGSILLRLQL